MKKILWHLAVSVIAVCACAVCHADESANDLVRVKSRGIGIDRGEALKDAFRAAVEQVVGVYVDAEQAAENDELIRDRVLVQSNAYIRDYELKSAKTRGDGLWEVVIVAHVKKQELTKTLRDAMPEKNFSLGDELKRQHQKLLAEKKKRDEAERQKMEEEKLETLRKEQEAAKAAAAEESQRIRDEKAAQLLSAALEGFNPYVTLLDVIQDPAVAPKVLGGDEDTQIRFGLRMRIDSDRYFKTVVPRLKQILGQISISEPRIVSCIMEPTEGDPVFNYGVSFENANVGSSIIDAYKRPQVECDGRHAVLQLSRCDYWNMGNAVWVITSFQKGGNGRARVSMTGYELADKPMDVWSKASQVWKTVKLRFKAELVGSDNAVVTGLSFSLKTKPLFMGWGPALCGTDMFHYYLAPLFFNSSQQASCSNEDQQRIRNLVRNCNVSYAVAFKAYMKAIRNHYREYQAYLTAYKELSDIASKNKKNTVLPGMYKTTEEEEEGEEPCCGFEIPLSCTFKVLSEELEKISTVRVRVFDGN